MKPVFIGGCDRSGTTLLGSMLGTHSECLCVPESQFIIETLNGSNFDVELIKPLAVLEMISKHPRFRIWEFNIESTPTPQVQSINSYPKLIEWIIRRYGETNGKVSPAIWIDHTPFNVKFASALFSLFPQAKMIHLIRDGRAVASSIMPLSWGPKAIDKAAYFWLRNLAYGFAAESAYGPNRVIRIKYEDLVNDSETTLKTICSFIDIDYQPCMVQGDGFKVPSFTRKQHSLVGKKPDPGRINAWENKLSPRQIEIFESTTGDMLGYLGYTPKFGVRARNMTNMERFISTLKTFQLFMSNFYDQAKLYWVSRKSLSKAIPKK